MRIKVIIPNSSLEFLGLAIEERRKAVPEGIRVDTVCLEHGPVSLESASDEALVASHLLGEVRKAENEGYNAVTIDCAADPIARAAREAVSIPVVSAGLASYQYAMGLCRRFSVITVLNCTASLIRDNISRYELSQKVASVRAADVPVLALKEHNKAITAIISESRRAIELDGAEAIVLGCTGMSSFTDLLQSELGVPVIDPAAAALNMAISLCRMNLTQSRQCFLISPAKEVL
ncbi:MAG: aspartate/glutamate racemase family protein [Bacillota bacterium]|jgi:allantoin racemase